MKVKQKELFLKGLIYLFIANIVCLFLGYLRDLFILKNIGISETTDAWYLVSNIPELIFKFMFLSAFLASFIPLFVEYLKQNGEEAWRIASSVINLSFIFLIILVILGMFFSNFLVFIFSPGFDKQTHLIAVKLLRVILPIVIFMTIVGILESIYRNYFNYFLTAISQIVNSSIILIFIIFYINKIGIFSVAYGTLFGFFFSFLILFLFIFIYKKPYRFIIDFKNKAIKKIFSLAIPLVLADIIGKSIGAVDRFFASFLDKGSIASLSMAYRIINFPLIFFSTTIGIAIFPVFVHNVFNKDEFKKIICTSVKFSFLLMVPIFLSFIVLGKDIISLLFEYGRFTYKDSIVLFRLIVLLSPTLFLFSIRQILINACYSLKKGWVIFNYEVIGFILNILLDYILMRYFGVFGIALATSFVATLCLGYLFYIFREYFDYKIILFLLKVIFASLIVGIYCFLFFNILKGLVQFKIITLFFAIGTSCLFYLFILKISKVEELSLLWKTIKTSILKNQIY